MTTRADDRRLTGPDAEDRPGSSCDLRASGVLNGPSAEVERLGGRFQQEEILLRRDLESDLGLTGVLPVLEQWDVGGDHRLVAGEGSVAVSKKRASVCESGVGHGVSEEKDEPALSSNLSLGHAEVRSNDKNLKKWSMLESVVVDSFEAHCEGSRLGGELTILHGSRSSACIFSRPSTAPYSDSSSDSSSSLSSRAGLSAEMVDSSLTAGAGVG